MSATIPTSEMPRPTFLQRSEADNWTQPIIRHQRHATNRCKCVRHRDEALHRLHRALDFRNESFVGFRGDLWREWREGMREASLQYRHLIGQIPGFKLETAEARK